MSFLEPLFSNWNENSHLPSSALSCRQGWPLGTAYLGWPLAWFFFFLSFVAPYKNVFFYVCVSVTDAKTGEKVL